MNRDADASAAADHIGWSRARVEQRGLIREVVFGAQDGLLTTLGLVAAVSGATAGRTSVLIAGFAGAIAGMLAMGAGAYISNRSQRDVQRAEIELERSEMERNPLREMAELVELFTGDGLPADDARVVATIIAEHPEAMLKAMAEKELGIPSEGGNALVQTVVIATAFLLGAVVPILPWFAAGEDPIVTIGPFGPSPALVLSVLLTGAALFAVGAWKGRLAGMGPAGGGLQMTAIGLGCATTAYLLGSVIPALLGVHPIA
jgi:vacuolar iron transporter family protein